MFLQVNLGQGLEEAWTSMLAFLPKFLAFLVILIIGWFVAKLVARGLDALLDRVGFDRMVERGVVSRAMDQTSYRASDLLSRILFYVLLLFVLQLAFGVFGPNPISDLITGVIAYLPKLFAAILIVIVAGMIATAVRDVVAGALGGLSYGNALAMAASVAILAIGVFAALVQLEIAPAIITGLFYALLAIVAGSAIIAIGGGGIMPMRRKWEQALDRIEQEAPRVRAEAEEQQRRRGEERVAS